MTFEEWWNRQMVDEWWEKQTMWPSEYNTAKAAWQAALQSERERAKELVESAEYAAEILDQYVQRHAHAKYVRSAIAKYFERIKNELDT